MPRKLTALERHRRMAATATYRRAVGTRTARLLRRSRLAVRSHLKW